MDGHGAASATHRSDTILRLAGVIGALVAWEVAERAGKINSLLFSSPTKMIEAGSKAVRSERLLNDIGSSAMILAIGLAVSIVVGVVVGLLAGRSRAVYYVIGPWLTILYAIPVVALVPLLIAVLGIGTSAKVLVILLFAVFPVAVNTLAGVQATSAHFVQVAHSFSASRKKMLTSVVVPGALPYILTGIRLAGGQALIGLVVSELTAGTTGIGYRLNRAGQTFNTGLLMFILMVLGLGGVLYVKCIQRIEGRFAAWRVE